jgi:hypothetical protein
MVSEYLLKRATGEEGIITCLKKHNKKLNTFLKIQLSLFLNSKISTLGNIFYSI